MKNNLSKICTSKHTFFVDRLIFTKEFPELRNHRLRVYLLMCRVVGAQNGTFFMSIVSIQAEVRISEHYVRDAINFLEANHFIKRVGKRGQANSYIVLTVPFYDHDTKRYTSNEAIPRTRSHQKHTQHGYCEMPVEVMVGSILRDKTKWTDRRIKILGQLYLYHWIDMYGGVDPNGFFCTPSSIQVNEFIAQTLGCSQKEAEHAVRWLISEDYAFEVEAVYRINPNSCEGERQFIGDLANVSVQPGDKVFTLIRMVCIPEIKVTNALLRTGGMITT